MMRRILLTLKKQIAAIKKGESAELPLFIGEKEGKKYYIIPMYGKGLMGCHLGFYSAE